MDISPRLLREVQFSEAWRGYDRGDVDDFLERLAIGLEEMQAIGRTHALDSDKGSDTEVEERHPGIILGEQLAEQLGAEVGDELAVLSPQANVGSALGGGTVSRRFVVDFQGGPLPMLAKEAKVESAVSASRGEVELVSARPLAPTGGWRAMFDVKLAGAEDTAEPVNLRLFLRSGDAALSETWLYQWTPPKDRRIEP